MYLSRRLSDTEYNYSNIEKEALAIVWTTNRARQFLIGKKFLLRSDHRPLEFMFNPRKELPKVTTSRILRWAIRLMAFDFDIEYVKGSSIPHVDALSRLRFNKESKDKSEEEFEDTFLHWVETDVLSLNKIAEETKNDPILSRIKSRISKNVWGNCSIAERPFKEIKHKLTVENGVICNGDLIVPPETQRKIIIKSVHDDVHCGIAATQKRLKLEAWWPRFTKDVEEYIKRCPKCKEIKPFTQTKLHSWPKEEKAWSRVHMDHAYINGVGLLLILVDSFSGWPEVIRVPDKKSSTVKHILRVIFSRNGVPNTLVSDNAPEFCDEDLNLWLRKIGCRPYKTPPYHPQSNGIAERMVRTVKNGLKACSQHREKIDIFLPRLLLSYRTIPHAGRLESPSALMGRQIRAPLTMSFATNEKMWYKRNKDSRPEIVRFLMQKGQNTAIVDKENGNSVLAHADQIRPWGEFEDQDEEMTTVPSVNDLLDQGNGPVRNETSEEESMSEQNECEISDEDQIMEEEYAEYSLGRDRSRSPRGRNTEEREREQGDPETGARRSSRSTRGIKPQRFRDMW